MRIPAALLLLAGCAVRPTHAPWNPQEKVISSTVNRPWSSLVVDTEQSGRESDGVPLRRTFYVYDESGDPERLTWVPFKVLESAPEIR